MQQSVLVSGSKTSFPSSSLFCSAIISLRSENRNPSWFLVLLPDIFSVLERTRELFLLVNSLLAPGGHKGQSADFWPVSESFFQEHLTLRDMSGTSHEESACFWALSPNQTHFFLLFQTNFRLGQQGRGVSMRFSMHFSFSVVPADLPHQEAG